MYPPPEAFVTVITMSVVASTTNLRNKFLKDNIFIDMAFMLNKHQMPTHK
jgi:hypothetical protein